LRDDQDIEAREVVDDRTSHLWILKALERKKNEIDVVRIMYCGFGSLMSFVAFHATYVINT